MKNFLRSILAFSIVFLCETTQAQCPTSPINLMTQAEIDAFAINYPNCTELPYSLYITGSSETSDITDLSPFSNLTHIEGILSISNCFQLSSLSGLENITYTAALSISSNPLLTSLSGLDNLTYVEWGIQIFNNSSLTSLSELSNLTTLGGELIISLNPLLISLSGLENIESFVENLMIYQNNSLSDISALQNIELSSLIGESGLYITNNPELSVCNLPNICAYLEGTGARTIEANAENCVSEQAVLAACNLEVTDNELNIIQLYPNPVKDILYIDKEINKITVTDLTGKVLFIENNISHIDMSDFQSGIYLITLEKDNQKQTTKIIKE